MSDESERELQALASRLFAAGRAERPGPALRRRLLSIEPAAGDAREDDGPRLQPRSGQYRAPRGSSKIASGLAAAVLVAAAAVAWLTTRAEPRLLLSAERLPAAVPREIGVEERRDVPVTPPSSASAPRAAPARVHANEPSANERATPAPRAKAKVKHEPSERQGQHQLERPTPPATAPSAAPPPPAVTATPPRKASVLEDIERLKRARAALRSGESARALQLLDQHERERASDGLVAEATLLRIEVLAALGRDSAASELAQRFVRENPNHALGDRARSFIDRAKGEP